MNTLNDPQSFAYDQTAGPILSAAAEPAVSFENLSKTYRMDRIEVPALRGVSGQIERADTTFIKGPSGSGKSTLLNLLGLLDRPTGGQLTILGEDVTRLSDRAAADFRAQHIGFVFQGFNLIPVLSVRENVEFPLLNRKMSAAARKDRAMEYLDAVGLSEFVDRRPGEISGGQRQRVAIARALVSEPSLVIADEPTANLDTKTSREIVDLMDRVRTELNTSVVICTHDTDLITPDSSVIHIIDGQTAKE
ncbi:ABC transporter ATP-binding protein [Primorskyibacter aestuariivivens]|uniref:ABC transporter ATP-binding protein n=1 Tax=Primorskyibacter aestuariivivens TaxID=1888912 RepID=UPI0023014DEE|nr:ABC transporter ATP-binding protein [Primorskyibacter aestuariivivens]MDA7429480.1 ABC transporter ATP-binding protein [Primorskyibacter aestuariivivens]